MVTKHLEKLQQEKEKQGFAKMQALHPSIGPTVCAIALEEADWVVEAAHELLSRFEEENKERIALLLLVSSCSSFRCVICWYAQLAFPAASTSLLCHLHAASDILHTGSLKNLSCACQITFQIACTSFLRMTLRSIGVSACVLCSTEKGWSFEGCLSSPSQANWRPHGHSFSFCGWQKAQTL